MDALTYLFQLSWLHVVALLGGAGMLCHSERYGFCDFSMFVSCRLRKLDPEEEDDPFNNYEVQSEAKLESFSNVGPHRLSFDSATFMESGRNGQCAQSLLDSLPSVSLQPAWLLLCRMVLGCFITPVGESL